MYQETLAGGFGAICCAYSGNPFDVVKIRLQTQSSFYRGPLDCFKKIFQEEGIFAYWKGVTPALGSAFIENSVLFTANGMLKRQYLLLRENESEELTSLEVATLGGLSGICSATCITPAEVIKCRVQILHNSVTLSSVLSSVFKDGPFSIFRGLSSTVARDVPFTFFFFGGYDLSKAILLLTKSSFLCSTPASSSTGESPPLELNYFGTYLAGGFGGAFAWSISFPMDSIKSKIQTTDTNLSIRQAAHDIYRSSGWRGFYRGWTAAVIRAFPANAGLILGYEFVLKLLT